MTLCIPSVIGGSGDQVIVSGSLMVDGKQMAEVYSYNSDPDHWQVHQAATTVVVDCPAQGTVWVQCDWPKAQIYGSATYPRTVFTGYAMTFHP